MERSGTTVSTSDRRGWCVLLCRSPEGDLAPPKELLDTLARKGLLVCLCRTSFDAMTELVIHERALREGGRRQPMVLMVVEPDDVPLCGELLRAAEKYAPHAACWQYSAKLKPKVQALRSPKEAVAPAKPADPPSTPKPPNASLLARPSEPKAGPAKGVRGVVDSVRAAGSDAFEHASPTQKPFLKLAWGPAAAVSPSPTRPKAAPVPDRPSYIDEEIEVGAPRPLDAKPIEARPSPSRRELPDDELPMSASGELGQPPPLLSDEELAILLWDTWYPERPGS